MASPSKKTKPASRSTIAAWKALTWSDLEDWAGPQSTSRGRSYQRQGRVKHLQVSDEGALLAWVHGGRRYATRVQLDTTKRIRSDRIVSACSCPVRFDCKHAVAVVVEYLEAIENGTDLPSTSEEDPRWAVIEGKDQLPDDAGDDWLDDDGEDDEVDEPTRPSRRPSSGQSRTRTRRRARGRTSDADIRSHLESKPHDDLVTLVMHLSARDPDVRKALADECALAGGRFDELLQEARSEMRSLTAEEAWWNPWKGEGHIPDYSGLEKRLRALLDHGYANAVVRLGQELVERGIEQIERSHDEGETCNGIGRCMEVVYAALLKSDRSDEDKIVYALDVLLADDYGLCHAFDSMLTRRWKKATWSAVAEQLRERLLEQPKRATLDDDWSRDYSRERLSSCVIDALDKAGRSDEATQLCVAEARDSGSYVRAVRRLLENGQLDQAATLARDGLQATSPQYRGIINELQDLLSEIAARNGDWMLPASVAADRFFRDPSVSAYLDLLKAAEKAGCEQAVKNAALSFLETGRRPDTGAKGKSNRKSVTPWPLPQPPQPEEREATDHPPSRSGGPDFDVLIDLAIHENRPNEVLQWFDRQQAMNRSVSRPWPAHRCRENARVARAVETSHPDRAIAIYEQLAHSIALETSTKTYPEAINCLKRIRSLVKRAGRKADWPAIMAEFRSKHGRKRRLMQMLDGIGGRPIVRRSRK